MVHPSPEEVVSASRPAAFNAHTASSSVPAKSDIIKMMKKISQFAILCLIITSVFVFSSNDTHAVTECGSQSIIGNTPPFWGSSTGQNVNISASKGSSVRISVKGEVG